MRSRPRKGRTGKKDPTEVKKAPQTPITGVKARCKAYQQDGKKTEERYLDIKRTMQGMMKLMEGMQLMQDQVLVKKQEVEVGKSPLKLQKLPEWKVDTTASDLTDWFLTIEPIGDLSEGSQQWWDAMLKAAKAWYVPSIRDYPPWSGSHTCRRQGRSCEIALLMAAILQA